MKKLLAGAAFLSLAATPAFAGFQDFTFVNNSPYTVVYLYGAADYEETWSADLLGDYVLLPGEEIYIPVNGYGDHCWFELLIEDEAGGSVVYTDIDLCTETHIFYE